MLFFISLRETAISQIFNGCDLWSLLEGRNVVILSKMGPRHWSLVGNKRWLLLGGSKCTIFVVVAHDLVSREVGRFSEGSLIEVLLYLLLGGILIERTWRVLCYKVARLLAIVNSREATRGCGYFSPRY